MLVPRLVDICVLLVVDGGAGGQHGRHDAQPRAHRVGRSSEPAARVVRVGRGTDLLHAVLWARAHGVDRRLHAARAPLRRMGSRPRRPQRAPNWKPNLKRHNRKRNSKNKNPLLNK